MSGRFVRSPRLRLLVNDAVVRGVYEATVTANNYFSADRFSACVAVAEISESLAYWSSAADLLVELQISPGPDSDYRSLITGFVDQVSVDPVDGAVVISGRDLSALLIDSHIQQTFANRTSSEIVTILAQEHGLAASIVETTTMVGRFYEDDREALTLNRYSGATSEWDLLCYLARLEKYDVFMAGQTLYFQPSQPAATRIIHLNDCIHLQLTRSLTLARDICVTVKSWNSQTQSSCAQQVTGQLVMQSDSGVTAGILPQQTFVVVRPNLSPDKAVQTAMTTLGEISRHERVVEITMPGELLLTPRDAIQLADTNTAFDQTYAIEAIERSFDTRNGFIQRVRASSSSPRVTSTVTVAE